MAMIVNWNGESATEIRYKSNKTYNDVNFIDKNVAYDAIRTEKRFIEIASSSSDKMPIDDFTTNGIFEI